MTRLRKQLLQLLYGELSPYKRVTSTGKRLVQLFDGCIVINTHTMAEKRFLRHQTLLQTVQFLDQQLYMHLLLLLRIRLVLQCICPIGQFRGQFLYDAL